MLVKGPFDPKGFTTHNLRIAGQYMGHTYLGILVIRNSIVTYNIAFYLAT